MGMFHNIQAPNRYDELMMEYSVDERAYARKNEPEPEIREKTSASDVISAITEAIGLVLEVVS